MKRIILIVALTLLMSLGIAQPLTRAYVQRDTCELYLDVYKPSNGNGYTVIFVFGGGFIMGARDAKDYLPYYQKLNEQGYTVVAIDYRLGLKGVDTRGAKIVNALDHAIQLATEDLLAATRYLIEHAAELNIDPQKIILSGSSAGAITVLQADYELCNRTPLAAILPSDFHYAGVISFAGAIYSHNGAPKYKEQPAPTFIMHGKEDNLVTYKSIRFGKLGFFGAKPLIKSFQKHDYPYMAYRYEGLGHEVAGLMLHNSDITDWFIQQYVVNKQHKQIDADILDKNVKHWYWGKIKASKIYGKKDKNKE